MRKPRIAIARIAYGGFHHAAVGDFLARTCHTIARDSRFGGLESFYVDRHGVCAARNLAVETARERGADFLVMVDADMIPDCVPGGAHFWDTSIAHVLALDRPCIVSAPCCKADGVVCVYQEIEEDDGKHLIFVSPDVAATSTGIEEVPAASLALSLIDMRCFDVLERPYFRFGYTDESESEVAWGEEVFTANCTENGMPVFCNWDAWCGHFKSRVVGKPVTRTMSTINDEVWVPESCR